MDHYAQYGNARLTCRHFDISPQTFYRWKRRFDPYDLTTLEDESRRPDHVRIPRIPAAVVERVLTLRQKYPRWGKDKLVVLLKKEGIQISTSSVGRVMKRLKDRGVLVEPLNVRLARAARKRRWKPRYAIRKPPGYRLDTPGDLVQVDTIQIRLQIDGGSKFKKHFEETCQRRNIRLFLTPPRSPKLQGYVERSNRTHREEFYEVEDIEIRLEDHNRQLEKWNDTYNYIRPHQSLDYLTPYQYYQRWLKKHKPKPSLML
jgi:putative transposase